MAGTGSTKRIITSDDILGKDVVDVDGEIIGVVQQLKIDKNSKKIIGILIDQGFMKPDLFIGLDYVKNFGVDSIFLNRSPLPKIKGMEVFDSNGKVVGFVSDIEVDGTSQEFKAIIIRKNRFGREFRLESKFIKTVGYNIILKDAEQNLKLEEVVRGQAAESN
ncbi:PRC-barrel domain-containing protein [Candidatus Woesearchaeota archaeon]|nr:PRC-barrel domain-containing protein [Candidatus Woesearchaeota archaeon]